MGDHPGPQGAPPAHGRPRRVEAAAPRTDGPGREAQPAARVALLHEQLAPGRAFPERGRLLGELREQDAGLAHAVLSSKALVGTPSPLVTMPTSAPSTCDVDVPRSCLTVSVMRLNPCT